MSAIFEFNYVEPKPTTKVESVFDLVNGNGQHHEDAKLTKFESKLLDRVQEANEHIQEFIDQSANDAAPPWDQEPEAKPETMTTTLEATAAVSNPFYHTEFTTVKQTETTLQTDSADDDPRLTPQDLLEGYSPANHLYQPIDAETKEILTSDSTGLIVIPESFNELEPKDFECFEFFEFIHSETLEFDEKAAIEQEIDDRFNAALDQWAKDYVRAEEEWIELKHDTEQTQVALALEVKRISDELKEVRQEHKSTITTLQDLNTNGPDYPEKPEREDFVPKPPKQERPPEPAPAKQAKETKPTTETAKPKEATKPNVDESWRKIRSETFLTTKMEGMGQKKLDVLLHEFPTLGDLVDLQTEASKKCMHLSKLLPKGIGEKLADAIDNAAMDTFRKSCNEECK